MFVYRADKEKNIQAHCTSCDTDVHAVVQPADGLFMCEDCLGVAIQKLFRAHSFFDNFNFIHELAIKLSMECGKLQRKDSAQPKDECEAAWVIALAAHAIAAVADNAAELSKLDGEAGLRRDRFDALEKEQSRER